MRSVVFPYAARILGVLAVVLEVWGVVAYVSEGSTSWLFLWLFLGGGVAAVVALGFASQAEPRGAGKRLAKVPLILSAAVVGFFALFVFVAVSFTAADSAFAPSRTISFHRWARAGTTRLLSRLEGGRLWSVS
jgi:hypothetical protein